MEESYKFGEKETPFSFFFSLKSIKKQRDIIYSFKKNVFISIDCSRPLRLRNCGFSGIGQFEFGKSGV